MIAAIIKKLLQNKKTTFKAILGLSVALMFVWGINLYKQNKSLSERLETAQNNIEVYLGIANDSLLTSNVLKLDMSTLQHQNDKLLQELDSVRKLLKIKPKQITTAATQTLVIYVNESKGVLGDLIEILKDTLYTDSIKYNNLTTVYYTIGKDTVNIGLNVKNTQYLYIYCKKEYKNKKKFLKRLFTLDFKKVKKYRYEIVNTNDLLETKDIRVIESIEK